LHFFKVCGTNVSEALQRVKQDLVDHKPQEWSDYLILGTLDIGADKFYYNVPDPGLHNVITNRADINKKLTEYVSAKNFNKMKELLMGFIMSENWIAAECVCRDLAGIKYVMDRKIDVADPGVPDINAEHVTSFGLSRIINADLDARKNAYLVEAWFLYKRKGVK